MSRLLRSGQLLGWSTQIQYIGRSEEHTSELQSQSNLVCRLLLEKKTQTNPLHILWQRATIIITSLAELNTTGPKLTHTTSPVSRYSSLHAAEDSIARAVARHHRA